LLNKSIKILTGRGIVIKFSSALAFRTVLVGNPHPRGPSIKNKSKWSFLRPEVRFLDLASTFDTNNLTIGRNSLKIMGLTENLIISQEDASIGLVYTGVTYGWKLIEN
jgi:hypothetical protein